MSGKCFIDTNILIYAHDETTGKKHDLACQLVDRLWVLGEVAISTQVLQEFCVSVRRRASRAVPLDELRKAVEDFLKWQVVINNSSSILKALEVEERYQVSFWDAMILQAAERAGAETLYSEDLSDGQIYGTVRVVNPLK